MSAMLEIVPYEPRYEDALMRLIRREGEDWAVYWREPNASRYRRAFASSATFLALADGEVCGYSRSLVDALYVYVCDLLVNEAYRGRGLGRLLLERTRDAYPDREVYIMSGSDGYYEKLGCAREGSVYRMR